MGSRVRPDYIIHHNEKYATWYYEHCPIEPVICASSLFKSELKFVLLYIGQHIESIPPKCVFGIFWYNKKMEILWKSLTGMGEGTREVAADPSTHRGLQQ